jgi:hypothetical protein
MRALVRAMASGNATLRGKAPEPDAYVTLFRPSGRQGRLRGIRKPATGNSYSRCVEFRSGTRLQGLELAPVQTLPPARPSGNMPSSRRINHCDKGMN